MEVIEQIKTFEDACSKLGDLSPFIRSYNGYIQYAYPTEKDKDIIAFLKLRIICAALNDGWEPKFTEDEYRYYPWFITDTSCDITIEVSSLGWSHSAVGLGSRLVLKTRELAKYCGKQFIDLWRSLYTGE